ncbi:hypothetical protein EXN66_Car015252 [Channa argus]|uniref:Uncharacterized protein n=1 Tax=Channa argus TaxID=215402 RepID=A0A6G1QAI9_CHAAH|nr:hypothetical protein EXN66_Car015252 [Channa argus]
MLSELPVQQPGRCATVWDNRSCDRKGKVRDRALRLETKQKKTGRAFGCKLDVREKLIEEEKPNGTRYLEDTLCPMGSSYHHVNQTYVAVIELQCKHFRATKGTPGIRETSGIIDI